MKPADLYNPLMTFILRSSLHGLISNNTMLITFTGRQSGKQYTTPISYAQEGNVITLITDRKHGWWKNLRGAVPVKVRVKGRDLEGTAQIVAANPQTLIAEIQKVYQTIPPEKAVQIMPSMVMIKIELN